MRRDDISLYLSPDDRAQLEALLTDRNTARKLVWRAEIILATADGCGTNEIMRRASTSKPTVWRWQERYLDEGVDGLKRDRTRPSRVPPLPREVRLSIRHAQERFSTQKRSALTSAFAVSISLRMSATRATFAGFPASRSAVYLAFRSGLKRMATSAGM